MNNHFICRLFFVLALSLLPITRNAIATIVENGMPGVLIERVRNEPGEFSIALAGHSYVNGRNDGDADYLLDYLSTSASHNTNFNGKHRIGNIGIGLNVTYLLEKLTGNLSLGIFDYIQVPYTYISTSGGYD